MYGAAVLFAGFFSSLALGVSLGAREAVLGAVAAVLLSLLVSWRTG